MTFQTVHAVQVPRAPRPRRRPSRRRRARRSPRAPPRRRPGSDSGSPNPSATTPTRRPRRAPGQRRDVVRRGDVGRLARVEPVRRRRCTPSISAASATVRVIGPRWSIGLLDRERAGVGHQPVGRLVPDDAAVRGGDPDRAALVAAGGDVDHAGRPPARRCRWTSRRRARAVPRVAHRPASARCAMPPEKHRSSHTALPAMVAPAASSRVTTVASRGGTKPSSGRRAVHHRHAGDRGVVLDRDRPPRQRALEASVIEVVTYQAPSGLSAGGGRFQGRSGASARSRRKAARPRPRTPAGHPRRARTMRRQPARGPGHSAGLLGRALQSQEDRRAWASPQAIGSSCSQP